FFSFFIYFSSVLALIDIFTLSLHDALPILDFLFFPPFFFCTAAFLFYRRPCDTAGCSDVFIDSPQLLFPRRPPCIACTKSPDIGDRKSTRLNSSHVSISYAVFCLK